MMRTAIVTNQDNAVAAWVQHQLGADLFAGDYSAIGVVDIDANVLIGGFVFYDFYPGADVSIAVAATSPAFMSRHALRFVAGYVFNQLGVRRVSATTPRKYVKARSILTRLGFKQEGVKRHMFGRRKDGVIYGLLRADWRHWYCLYRRTRGRQHVAGLH